MMRWLFLILLVCGEALAAKEIEDAFKVRNYGRVAGFYRANPDYRYTKKDYVMIGYSLRRIGAFREDVKVSFGSVKRFHNNEHQKVLSSIQNDETIDGDEVPEALKIHYWNLFNDFGQILKGYGEKTPGLEQDLKHFQSFAKILSEVEFREGKVDRTVDSVMAHLQYLSDKIYHFKRSFFVQYVSWQQEATLSGPTDNTGLVITNRGFCTGGELGWENYRYHFYVDGCYLYGAGGVKNTGNASVDYQQSNLPAWGLKGGPGASVIVSSTKSRIGFKVPILYTVQELTNPDTAGYTITDKSQLSYLTTLYSRWQFGDWYFSTEFGKYVKREESFWGLGLGREF